jgi:hypothetical protein
VSTGRHSIEVPTPGRNCPRPGLVRGRSNPLGLGRTATETSDDGTAPAQTIQGLSTTLAYTVTEQQQTPLGTNR